MNAPAQARYCDGETLRSRDVQVEMTPDRRLHVTAADLDLLIAIDTLHVSDALGHVPRFARTPEGRVLEFDADEFEALLPDVAARSSRLAQLVHRLESLVAVAAVATLVLVAGIASTLWFGLPRLARRAAMLVPPSIEAQIGEKSYQALSQSIPEAKVDYFDQLRFEDQLAKLRKAHAIRLQPQLHYLQMEAPNAFALPGGVIVITDGLVKLNLPDDQIAAILAHELGHVEKRHGVQSILRSSSALIVVATVTGDLSTLTSFAGTLPFMLLQSGYSREFEREADAYAVECLRAAKINPGALADVLERLEKSQPKIGPDFSYLSTHPSTPERIQAIRGAREKKK